MQRMSVSHFIYFLINQNPSLSNYAISVLQSIASLKRIFYYLGIEIEFNEHSGAIDGGGGFSIGISVNY
jgi:hypothetical protein